MIIISSKHQLTYFHTPVYFVFRTKFRFSDRTYNSPRYIFRWKDIIVKDHQVKNIIGLRFKEFVPASVVNNDNTERLLDW